MTFGLAISSKFTTQFKKLQQTIDRFLFAPARTEPLAFIRIGVAVLLLLQVLSIAPHFFDLYGPQGILQRDAKKINRMALISYQHWIGLFTTTGFSERTSLLLLAMIYVISLSLLLVGWKTRLATIATWLTHLMLSQEPTTYGLDQYAHQTLFLLMWSPCGTTLSLDAKLKPQENLSPLPSARLALRTMQFWFAFAYMASGFSKSLGAQWWDGEAIWRSVMLPTFRHFDMAWLAEHSWVAMLAARGTLVVEGLYPIFIWPSFTRKAWVIFAVLLHTSIAIFMGLWLFAAIMIVLNIGLFAISPEPVVTQEHKLHDHERKLGDPPIG